MVARTIELDPPRTGKELWDAVKAVANESREVERGVELQAKFHSVHEDEGTYQLGQVSGYGYEHIRVTPTAEEDCIHLDATYDKVVVSSYGWPFADLYFVEYNQQFVVSAVRSFTEKLKHELSGAETPAVWPQAVEVCRYCGVIVRRFRDRQLDKEVGWCSEHGEVHTRTVQVMPLTD